MSVELESAQNDWKEFMWQPVVDGLTRDVPIRYLSNHPMPEVLLYPGLGEEALAVAAGVKAIGDAGLRAAGVVLPFHYLEAAPANIERTVIEAPNAIAQDLSPNKPVNLIGKSQGGGVALISANEAPELYNAIGLISPAGLTNDFLGKTEGAKRRKLLWRLGVANIMALDQSPLIDRGNLIAAKEIFGRVWKDWRGDDSGGQKEPVYHRLKTKVNYAVNQNLAPLLVRLEQLGHPLRVFASETDLVFKRKEIHQALGQSGLEHLAQDMLGGHVSLLTRKGYAQMHSATSWVKDNKAK